MPGTLNYIRYPSRRRRQRDHRHDAPRDDARRHGRGRAPRATSATRTSSARRPSCRCSGASCRSSPTSASTPSSAPAPSRSRRRTTSPTSTSAATTGWRPSRPSARTAASPRPAARTPGSRSRRPPSASSPTCARSARSRRSRTTRTASPPATAAARPSSRSSASSGSCDMDELKKPAIGRGARRQGAVHARALGPRLPRLDGEPAPLVHQPPALVGPPAAGVVLRRLRRRRSCAETEPQALRRVRLGTELDARDRRARHLVQLGAVAVRHLGLAGRDRRPGVLLPDERAQHGARDHLPLGRAHGDDGPRVHRRHPVRRRLHPLGDPGRRRAAHEQEPRHRHRPAGDDRQVRRRRHALRPAAHEQHPGRALQRREDRHGPRLRQQAVERVAARAAGQRGRTRPSAATADQVDRWIASRFQRCLARRSRRRSAAYDFAAAVDTLYHFVWDEFCDWYLELVKVRLYGEDEAQQGAGRGSRALDARRRSCACCTRSCRSSPRRSRRSTARRRCSSASIRCTTRRCWRRTTRRPIGELQAAVNALRALPRRGARSPPGKVLSGACSWPTGGGAAQRYAPYAGVFRALARTEVASTASRDGGRDRGARAGRPRSRWRAAVDKAEEIARLEQQLAKARGRGRARRGQARQRERSWAALREAVVAKEREKLAGLRRRPRRAGRAARAARARPEREPRGGAARGRAAGWEAYLESLAAFGMRPGLERVERAARAPRPAAGRLPRHPRRGHQRQVVDDALLRGAAARPRPALRRVPLAAHLRLRRARGGRRPRRSRRACFGAAVERVRAPRRRPAGGARRDDAVRGAHRRGAPGHGRERRGGRRARGRPRRPPGRHQRACRRRSWCSPTSRWSTPRCWATRGRRSSPRRRRSSRAATWCSGALDGLEERARRRLRRRRRARRTSCASRGRGDVAVEARRRTSRSRLAGRGAVAALRPACALPTPALYQVVNAALAVAAVRCCSAASTRPPCGRRWPARPCPVACRWSRERPLVLADGAHNPDGVRALAQSLAAVRRPRRAWASLAIMRDKDDAEMLAGLLPLLDAVVCTQASEPRSLAAEELAAAVRGRRLPAAGGAARRRPRSRRPARGARARPRARRGPAAPCSSAARCTCSRTCATCSPAAA